MQHVTLQIYVVTMMDQVGYNKYVLLAGMSLDVGSQEILVW